MVPRRDQWLQDRTWDDLVREPPRSGPLSLASVSPKSSKTTRFGRKKRVFFELFADTGAKERGPDLEGSLIKPSKVLAWCRPHLASRFDHQGLTKRPQSDANASGGGHLEIRASRDLQRQGSFLQGHAVAPSDQCAGLEGPSRLRAARWVATTGK